MFLGKFGDFIFGNFAQDFVSLNAGIFARIEIDGEASISTTVGLCAVAAFHKIELMGNVFVTVEKPFFFDCYDLALNILITACREKVRTLQAAYTLIDETSKIMNAQKARGADFSSGGLIKRAKALIPIIIPLFVSSFRRAEELATAMECRCYHGGNGRTRMNVLKMKMRDYVFIIFSMAMLAGVILINIYANGYKLA